MEYLLFYVFLFKKICKFVFCYGKSIFLYIKSGFNLIVIIIVFMGFVYVNLINDRVGWVNRYI